jgi:hypothetical protein
MGGFFFLASRTRGVFVSADDRAVDAPERPGNPLLLGQAGLEVTEELLPEPARRPPAEPAVDGLPGAVAFGEIPPGHPGVKDKEDTVEDAAMIMIWPPAPPRRGEQRLEQSPFLIGELVPSWNHHRADLLQQEALYGRKPATSAPATLQTRPN